MSWQEKIAEIDIYVSSLFYDNGHFAFEENILGNLIRKGIPEIIVFSAVLIFLHGFGERESIRFLRELMIRLCF